MALEGNTSASPSPGPVPGSGATEHGYICRGAIAYTNVGLPGEAFRSKRWNTVHRPKFVNLFNMLLQHSDQVIGLALSEVGHLDDVLTQDEIELVKTVVTEAFMGTPGATEHVSPNSS